MEKKTIAVTGMMCAGCAANVERRLRGMDGVEAADVNFAARTVLVTYNPDRTKPADMQAELEKIGYGMVVDNDSSVEEIEQQEVSRLCYSTLCAWVAAIAMMSLSMSWILADAPKLSLCLQIALALIVMAVAGRQFYVNAWQQLRHRMANMDTLVAMSTMVSFLYSLYNVLIFIIKDVRADCYFDATVMIIAFILTGRLIEARAKKSTSSALRSLVELAPKTARVVVGTELHDVPISTISVGDVIELRAGERVAVDGTVSEGQAFIDESMISGEPIAVSKNEGAKVYAGTMNKQGTMRYRATEVGDKTVLSQIITRVKEAQGSKAPIQRVVDRVAGVFVPVVLIIAMITCGLWLLFSGGDDATEQAILHAVAVLVIACPCALGLATPTALMVGLGQAARHNILIKDAAALETIHRIDALVIDKTGTLTIPRPDVDFTKATDLSLEERETLKPHAREAIEALHRRGIEVYMMSGDSDEAAAYWVQKAGIRSYKSRVMPQDKENLVRQLQSEGHCVAMVGDGINDTQALATADVSIAMARGTDIAIDVAQLTLVGDDLRNIPEAVSLSRRTVGMIRQNLFWAFIYNIVCIPLAAGLPAAFGLSWHISPMLASALMAFSSVSVVLNSLRLKLKG